MNLFVKILNCSLLKARQNNCNITQCCWIQHCWTMLYSVEGGGQPNATRLMQHLDSGIWDQNLSIILKLKQTHAAPYRFARKMARDRSTSVSDHILAFPGLFLHSELLLKFIGFFPDYLLALSRTLLRFFGQPLSKQLYKSYKQFCNNVSLL